MSKRAKSEYGFHKDDVPYGRAVGQTIYWDYGTAAQAKMINVTAFDGGYLKMQMTSAMKKALYPWYEERLKDAVQPHGNIAGGYSNAHKVSMGKIDLVPGSRCTADRLQRSYRIMSVGSASIVV